MKKARTLLLTSLLLLCSAAYVQHDHPIPEKLGTVSFPTSCSAQVQGSFNRAVALLHSFTYTPAAEAFADVARQDPKCAMAHWGIAMSYYHQLWAPQLPGDAVAKGHAELEQAQQIGGGTPREKELITAASLLFQDGSDY